MCASSPRLFIHTHTHRIPQDEDLNPTTHGHTNQTNHTHTPRAPATTTNQKQTRTQPQTRTWSLWEYEIPQAKLEGKTVLEVAVKATDTSYNVQPERIEPYWNLVRFVAFLGPGLM